MTPLLVNVVLIPCSLDIAVSMDSFELGIFELRICWNLFRQYCKLVPFLFLSTLIFCFWTDAELSSIINSNNLGFLLDYGLVSRLEIDFSLMFFCFCHRKWFASRNFLYLEDFLPGKIRFFQNNFGFRQSNQFAIVTSIQNVVKKAKYFQLFETYT